MTELHDLLELVPGGRSRSRSTRSSRSRRSRGASRPVRCRTGALSAEAHETLAIAMNMIGGKSNCGEGGEDPARYRTRGTARDRNSRIKQIASGRFGVTPEYCAYADELNIKIAQGSKPGEGGQLPGPQGQRRDRAAAPHPARRRPDLAAAAPRHLLDRGPRAAHLRPQAGEPAGRGVGEARRRGRRRHDRRRRREGARRGRADLGRATAAPARRRCRRSRTPGCPWELGLADAQRTLIENGLRDRVRVRVDGGFKTGRDVVIAALLGADEYSFGTAAMLAEGCIMVRACHRDTCPTGIATQRPGLRAKFAGTPEGVATYMMLRRRGGARAARVARAAHASTRRSAASSASASAATGDARADSLDLSPLLRRPADADAPRRLRRAPSPIQRPRSELDARLLDDAFPTVWEGGDLELEYEITNADRTVGASLGGAIGLEFGELLPPGSVTARFTGSAGQSFGAFLADGVTLELVGEAQDYVGKGMGGGRIVVRPPADDAGDPVLAGNTVLYGATGGQLFVAGRVGERFCVRNSGATAVVEGAGDHACEYMTGGTVVILGAVRLQPRRRDDRRPGVRVRPRRTCSRRG